MTARPNPSRTHGVRGLRAILITLSLVATAALTLSPGGTERGTVFACIVCGERWVSDVLANLLLLVPLGIALATNGTTWKRALLLGGGVSLGIELLQLFIPGRDASVGDVLFNAVGAAVGAALYAGCASAVTWRDRAANLAALGLAACAVPLTLAVAALRAPALPASVYFGQWTPRLGHLEWYRGRLETVMLDGARVPSHQVEDSDRARIAIARLLSGEAQLALRGRTAAGTSAMSSMFSVADSAKREILLVGVLRDDLVLRWYSRASRWRLDQPDLRAVGALRGITPGSAIDVRLALRGRHWCVAVNDHEDCTLALSPARAWAFVLWPEGAAPIVWRLLDAVSLAALGFPMGLLLRDARTGVAAVVIAAVGLLWLPTLTGLAPIDWTSAVAAVGGVAIGRLIFVSFRGSPLRPTP